MQFFIAKFIPSSSEGAFPEDQHLGHRKGLWTVDSEFIINMSMYYVGILSELFFEELHAKRSERNYTFLANAITASRSVITEVMVFM